jgi:hypothetical protein
MHAALISASPKLVAHLVTTRQALFDLLGYSISLADQDLCDILLGRHIMAGTPLAELQELGAWKSERMAKRYAHFASKQLRSAADRLATFSLQVANETPQKATQHVAWLPDQGSNLGPAD